MQPSRHINVFKLKKSVVALFCRTGRGTAIAVAARDQHVNRAAIRMNLPTLQHPLQSISHHHSIA
jgi:hypothetical protein